VVFSFENEEYGYELQAGLPSKNEYAIGTVFKIDPRIKEETLWPVGTKRRVLMLKRDKPSAWLRNGEGDMVSYPFAISKYESVLSQIIDPHLYPEISALRQEMLNWRFYHHFRTDAASLLRQPQIGQFTPVLSSDGSDLAAALRTIIEIGDDRFLHETVAEAFGGASLEIRCTEEMLFSVHLRVPGLIRALDAREFSDGQLRFLCLCAALLSPRPPALLGLNEPETSLHPDVLVALSRLITNASKSTQLWITTHSIALAESIERESGSARVRLQLVNGETQIGR
jgi:predicted ATPase